MHLGAFSVSLAVKDIAASRALPDLPGFGVFGGNQEQNWLILKSPTAVIGLFQGMFDSNIITFNPGWDSDAQTLPDFTNVRAIEAALRARGLTLTATADPATADPTTTTGPAHIILTDPDGNAILIDQHLSSSSPAHRHVPGAPPRPPASCNYPAFFVAKYPGSGQSPGASQGRQGLPSRPHR